MDLDIEATRKRSSFTAHVEYDLDKTDTPIAANMLFSERRCICAFKALSAVRGDMVFNGRHVYLDPGKTTGIFRDYKGFYPYRMRSAWCTACGADEENRYGFSLGETVVRENHKHNENALWLNGRLIPLPPVRITMPNGVESDWVIQDIEGMVDLTFTPQVQSRSAFNLILTSWEFNTPLGYYNGMLVHSEGEKIQVRNLWGLGEKLYLRV
jgi:hypothetical protein